MEALARQPDDPRDGDPSAADPSERALTLQVAGMIRCGELVKAMGIIKMLPPSTAELPLLLGELISAMSLRTYYYDEAVCLTMYALAYCSPHPAITSAFTKLAALLLRMGEAGKVKRLLEAAVENGYAAGQSGASDLVRRMAYRCRRSGDAAGAACMRDGVLARPVRART